MSRMAHKIATCNYCGTRAALVLDRDRHELACSSCGAPLHEMKAMPKANAERPRARLGPMPLPGREYRDDPHHAHPPRPRKRKRRKGLGRRMLEEIWDVVEDIFD